MTDRGLLELAAKAAGYNARFVIGKYTKDDRLGMFLLNYGTSNQRSWNPLQDDGDALRLAVELNMDIEIGRTFVKATWYDLIKSETHTTELSFSFPQDKEKCVKRAIVLAASEIGETK